MLFAISPSLDEQVFSETRSRFVLEPLEPGFGYTLGNSLRRTLLSSIPGAAITTVKFDNAQHEFTTLPGMTEDVTEFIMNLKDVVVKNETEEPVVIRLDVKGPKAVLAGDLPVPTGVQVLNPDLHLAQLNSSGHLALDITIENGRGYVPSSEHSQVSQEIGIIPVDALYSPVTRVRYEVEETRVGQKTNYDKLTMEIWTNGTVTPELALVEAAKILRKHLNPFVQYSEPGPEVSIDDRPDSMGGSSDSELERKLSMSLAELELSVRATNCLETEGITTVRDLVSRSEAELLEVRNFGETTLKEVKQKLSERGMELGQRIPGATRR